MKHKTRLQAVSSPEAEPAISPQSLNQFFVEALLMGAKEASARKNVRKALALLNEAHRREPGNVYVLLNMAIVHGKSCRYDHADHYLARALKVAPQDAHLHALVAQAYSCIDRPDRAVEFYRSSLARAGDSATRIHVLVELAGHLERRHELAQAVSAVEEALRMDPSHLEARYLSAVLAGRSDRTTPAESTLRSLLQDAASPPGLRLKASHELAQLLDRQGCYEEAFRVALAAKEQARPLAAPLCATNHGIHRKWEDLRQALDGSCYNRFAARATNDEPRRCAILAGHPRTGTTLLAQALDCHDGLVGTDEQDPLEECILHPLLQAFPPGTPMLSMLDHASQEARRTARQMYFWQTEAILGRPIGKRVLLDKHPAVTEMLPVINWALPEMKMIVALRDPRDVIISCFLLNAPLTLVSVNWLSIEEAADYYAHQMRCWLTVRDRTRSPWMEVRYEDTIADLEKQARRVLDFLGLSWTDEVLRFHEHARNKRVRSPTYKEVIQPVYSKAVGRWRSYARYLAPVADKLAPFIEAFGYDLDSN